MDFNFATGTLPIINLQKFIIIAEADRLGLVDHDAYIKMIKKLLVVALLTTSEEEDKKE